MRWHPGKRYPRAQTPGNGDLNGGRPCATTAAGGRGDLMETSFIRSILRAWRTAYFWLRTMISRLRRGGCPEVKRIPARFVSEADAVSVTGIVSGFLHGRRGTERGCLAATAALPAAVRGHPSDSFSPHAHALDRAATTDVGGATHSRAPFAADGVGQSLQALRVMPQRVIPSRG